MDKKDLTNAVLDAFEEMQKAKRDFEKQKCEILISKIEGTGQERLIKMLKEQGLPKQIMVSTGINFKVRTLLSFFAEVHVSSMLKDPSIYFSWVENILDPKNITVPNFADSFTI